MKKKIIGFTVLALGAIILAACSNSDGSFTEYKFDYSKGNNVDSITFKDSNNKIQNITKTINNTNKYYFKVNANHNANNNINENS